MAPTGPKRNKGRGWQPIEYVPLQWTYGNGITGRFRLDL